MTAGKKLSSGPARAKRQSQQVSELTFDAALALAGKLAKEDTEKVRFTVDAGLINRLGLELVSKQETAVAELVKNSYDADAITVDLIFKNTDKPGGTLEVIDNGVGMTRDQIVDGFMRISTSEKISNPLSEKYKRHRAGRKGIGRFSAQRLGTKLVVQTRKEGAAKGLIVTINWDRFLPGAELASIAHEIHESPDLAIGTTLKIDGLRDSWGETNIARSFRYVSTLQPPFPISKIRSKKVIDPGFKANFYLDDKNELKVVADEEKNFLEHALAKIEATVDDEGAGRWSLKCDRFKINLKNRFIERDREKPKSRYRFIKNVRLSASYFILQSTLLPKPFFAQIREDLDKWGGIRVYRNGFRVLPYGEVGDDWLRLERSSAVREILPPHRNRNFVGAVYLTDPEGSTFEETASREGLVENDAYDELRDFVSRVLKAAASAVAEERGKKVLTKDPRTTKPKTAKLLIGELRAALSKNPFLLKRVDALAIELEELNQVQDQTIDEIAMLRVLGSLGLAIGEFTHEIRHNLVALVADASTIDQKVPPKSPVHEPIRRLKANLGMLRSYARYFDEAVADNAHRELKAIELRDVLNGFQRLALPMVQRYGVNLEVVVDGYDLFTRPMHASEWASILLNLLTNSLKAIKRRGEESRLRIRAGADGNRVFVEFSDTGDGIPEENKEKVFDAFFTTSSPPSFNSSQNEELIGAGLGLKITKDIVESHEGEIMLITPPKGYKTSFRVEVPKATKADIGDGEA